MANKKKIEERLKARQAKRNESLIRWGGGAVLAIVAIGLIWLFANGRTSNQDEPIDVPESSIKQYDAYPDMTIDITKTYYATFVVEKGGEFKVQLFADKAPKTVNNFVFLAQDGFYDGTTFHRVIEGFMAQGGDPTGTGTGGPGYEFEDEFDDSLVFDGEGILAMANSGANTNGSQFFITYGPTDWLNGMHTIFGRVIEGMDVVKGLTPRDPNAFPDYTGDAIRTITITEE